MDGLYFFDQAIFLLLFLGFSAAFALQLAVERRATFDAHQLSEKQRIEDWRVTRRASAANHSGSSSHDDIPLSGASSRSDRDRPLHEGEHTTESAPTSATASPRSPSVIVTVEQGLHTHAKSSGSFEYRERAATTYQQNRATSLRYAPSKPILRVGLLQWYFHRLGFVAAALQSLHYIDPYAVYGIFSFPALSFLNLNSLALLFTAGIMAFLYPIHLVRVVALHKRNKFLPIIGGLLTLLTFLTVNTVAGLFFAVGVKKYLRAILFFWFAITLITVVLVFNVYASRLKQSIKTLIKAHAKGLTSVRVSRANDLDRGQDSAPLSPRSATTASRSVPVSRRGSTDLEAVMEMSPRRAGQPEAEAIPAARCGTMTMAAGALSTESDAGGLPGIASPQLSAPSGALVTTSVAAMMSTIQEVSVMSSGFDSVAMPMAPPNSVNGDSLRSPRTATPIGSGSLPQLEQASTDAQETEPAPANLQVTITREECEVLPTSPKPVDTGRSPRSRADREVSMCAPSLNATTTGTFDLTAMQATALSEATLEADSKFDWYRLSHLPSNRPSVVSATASTSSHVALTAAMLSSTDVAAERSRSRSARARARANNPAIKQYSSMLRRMKTFRLWANIIVTVFCVALIAMAIRQAPNSDYDLPSPDSYSTAVTQMLPSLGAVLVLALMLWYAYLPVSTLCPRKPRRSPSKNGSGTARRGSETIAFNQPRRLSFHNVNTKPNSPASVL